MVHTRDLCKFRFEASPSLLAFAMGLAVACGDDDLPPEALDGSSSGLASTSGGPIRNTETGAGEPATDTSSGSGDTSSTSDSTDDATTVATTVTPDSTSEPPVETGDASAAESESTGTAEVLRPYPQEEYSAGHGTVFDETSFAFSQPLRTLERDHRNAFFVGNSLFSQNWVQAPASTEGRDGVGPLFNSRACSGCHFHDGRGTPPEPGEDMLSMLLRLGIPGSAEDGGPLPEPNYGDQLQPFALTDVPGEGRVVVTYEEVPGSYGDGEPYALRVPSYAFEDLAYGPLAEDLLLSPRVGPAVIGLGLLEAIAEADLLALADPEDADGDAISGRPNYPTDPRTGLARLGRFGWKANQVDMVSQNSGAFLGDLGITSSVHPLQNCTSVQVECMASLSGGEPELADEHLDFVNVYTRTIAVPARRNVGDPTVLQGRERFREFGCAACHVPSFVTSDEGPEIPELHGELIWPYTDLLLHDMGEGLADGRPDYDATGQEWRTPPLWGLGLIPTVSGHFNLLHDGRARGIAEAILWHGGEAEGAKEAFRLADATDRAALVAFLESM